MVESMAATAERIREYEILHGKREVETFLDAVLAIEEHIDPSLMRPKLSWSIDDEEESEEIKPAETDYDDLWALDGTNKPTEKPIVNKRKKIPTKTRKRCDAIY